MVTSSHLRSSTCWKGIVPHADTGVTVEQAQAGLDLALQLLHVWCVAGKAEQALAWISTLIAESSGTMRAPIVAEGVTAGAACLMRVFCLC